MLMIVLAGIGLWFLIEGAMYALAPEAMKKFGDWLSQLPESSIRQAGIFSMLLGAVMLYVVIRFF